MESLADVRAITVVQQIIGARNGGLQGVQVSVQLSQRPFNLRHQALYAFSNLGNPEWFDRAQRGPRLRESRLLCPCRYFHVVVGEKSQTRNPGHTVHL